MKKGSKAAACFQICLNWLLRTVLPSHSHVSQDMPVTDTRDMSTAWLEHYPQVVLLQQLRLLIIDYACVLHLLIVSLRDHKGAACLKRHCTTYIATRRRVKFWCYTCCAGRLRILSQGHVHHYVSSFTLRFRSQHIVNKISRLFQKDLLYFFKPRGKITREILTLTLNITGQEDSICWALQQWRPTRRAFHGLVLSERENDRNGRRPNEMFKILLFSFVQ